MAQRSSSSNEIVAKRMLSSASSSRQVSVLLPSRFYKWHLCQCWDFVALWWCRECRAGRQQFTFDVVPYAVRVCLSWVLMSDVTLRNHRDVRTLIGTYYGIWPGNMKAQMMLDLMSSRRMPELIRSALP
jgi:hypothetical protein